jgi:hypothetical protein
VTLVGVPAVARAADQPSRKQVCIDAAERGQTERDDGKYRAARASFLACAQDGCPRVVLQSCTKWLREIDESAPTIVLGAKDERGDDLADVRVTLDGAPFTTHFDGKPVEVDTGEHAIRFERDGCVPVEERVLLRAGEKARVVSAVLRPINMPGASPPGASSARTPTWQTEPVMSPRHVISASMAVAALAAAGAGTFFLFESNHEQSTAELLREQLGATNACAGGPVPSPCPALKSAVGAQHDDLAFATGLWAGAGALVAGALATWLLWPRSGAAESPATATVDVWPGGALARVGGRF